ncbi:MAG: DUF5719 family protein [Candidatus Geothermincolia bacterium]
MEAVSCSSFVFSKTRVLLTLVLVVSLAAAFVHLYPGTAGAGPGDILLGSASQAGVEGNGATESRPAISADGRYVVFVSTATNLVAPATSGSQVFRKDLSTGEVRLSSCNMLGDQGNGTSTSPDVSADGRYVVFASSSTNLIAGLTLFYQVFRKDMQTGQVLLCSCTAGGTEGNANSTQPAISDSGRYVAFDSVATNLVIPATNHWQVFRKDLSSGTVYLCSATGAGVEANQTSSGASITADGLFVIFHTDAPNMAVPAPTNRQVYRKNPATGALTLCSTNAAGIQGNDLSDWADVSADGRYVFFESLSVNLVAQAVSGMQIFRKDMLTGAVALCSTNSNGSIANADCFRPSANADARYVAFRSTATNLVSPATTVQNSFRKDIAGGGVALCSSSAFGAEGNAGTESAVLSADGKFSAFRSAATNLVSPPTTLTQVFRKEITYPSATWYLAEGTSAWGFSTYISIENANPTAVTASVTYMTSSGAVTGPDVLLPPMSQATVNPAETVPDQDFSTMVQCKTGRSIAVDRTMSWTGQGAASPEGHSSVGVTAPATTWYLPEGSSEWGFECWLLIQNPNTTAADCTVTYMTETEGAKVVHHTVPPSSRATFNMETDIGKKDSSIMVSCPSPVIPERAMYRNNRREGHDSIGTTAPALDYFLAEGTTAWGFTTYVLVQNPHGSPTDVTVTYMTPSGSIAQPVISIPANSRETIRINDIADVSNTDLSTRVHGSQSIIAERAMYWNNGTGEACHDSIGMSSAHMRFFLPDGQVSEGRETWTLVQNPNASEVQVEISYLTPTGAGNVTFTDTVPAASRKTYAMADNLSDTRAAVMVTSLSVGKPIMVERAMYWNSRGAGTDTIGGYSD